MWRWLLMCRVHPVMLLRHMSVHDVAAAVQEVLREGIFVAAGGTTINSCASKPCVLLFVGGILEFTLYIKPRFFTVTHTADPLTDYDSYDAHVMLYRIAGYHDDTTRKISKH
uniref:Putative secreted protein n=1 Tax=Anopheles darlingi TaxID=43151 RepID=A0A2M4D202_ANODA